MVRINSSSLFVTCHATEIEREIERDRDRERAREGVRVEEERVRKSACIHAQIETHR